MFTSSVPSHFRATFFKEFSMVCYREVGTKIMEIKDAGHKRTFVLHVIVKIWVDFRHENEKLLIAFAA